ncbi:MAG: NUDIX domain-containing protein [Clostridia bacterium]
MLFNEEIIDRNILSNKAYSVEEKRAVRAVIFNRNNILLMKVNDAEYKLPGGTAQPYENNMKALIREIKEKTGFVSCIIKENIGQVLERCVDRNNRDSICETVSSYYVCEVFGAPAETNLSVSEKLDRMEAVWISIDEAIEKNEIARKQNNSSEFLNREIMSLNQIKNEYFKLKTKEYDEKTKNL